MPTNGLERQVDTQICEASDNYNSDSDFVSREDLESDSEMSDLERQSDTEICETDGELDHDSDSDCISREDLGSDSDSAKVVKVRKAF